MKSYKLTPLDELHLEKKRVREERAISDNVYLIRFSIWQIIGIDAHQRCNIKY